MESWVWVLCKLKKKMINLNLRDFKDFENRWLGWDLAIKWIITKKYQNTNGIKLIKSCSNFPVSDLRGHPRVQGQWLLVNLDSASVMSDAVLRSTLSLSWSHYIWCSVTKSRGHDFFSQKCPQGGLRKSYISLSRALWAVLIKSPLDLVPWSHRGHKVSAADITHLGVVSVSVSRVLGSIGGGGALSLAGAGLGHVLSQVAAGVVNTVAVAL